MADQGILKLPAVAPERDTCLRQILQQRRTHRGFGSRPLSLDQVAQLLWAAQGISSDEGLRTAPSAGALYPLEVHLVAARVNGLPAGHYRYDPMQQTLRNANRGDLSGHIVEAALGQAWIAQAPAIFIISAVESRTTHKYGRRGVRYVHMEAGNVGQNLLLQATALGLVAATVGAFDDRQLQQVLEIPEDERPLLILPVGYPD